MSGKSGYNFNPLSTMKSYRLFFLLAACLLPVLGPGTVSGASASGITLRIMPEREVLTANQSQRLVLQIYIDSVAPPVTTVDRPPLNLCLVIDRSGSMSGDRIVRAREAALAIVDRLSEQDIFSLVTYDSHVETVFPAGHVTDKAALARQIRQIQPRGMTALYGGVSQGAAELRKHLDQKAIHRMLLISDGIANVGPASPDDLGRLGTALRKEGIAVTTVGLGLDYNENLMTQLAGRSDGNTYFVEAAADLPRILDAEFGDALTVVANRAVLEIQLPEGVTPVRIIGREGNVRGNRVEVSFNQLYGGQQRYVLLEVDVASTPADQQRQLGKAVLRYQDIVSGTPQVTPAADATVAFSHETEKVQASTNTAVQQELLLNEAVIAKDAALDLAASGRREEASVLLRQTAERMRSMPQAAAAPEVATQIGDLVTLSDRLEESELDGRSQKAIRAESYQLRNQQNVRQ